MYYLTQMLGKPVVDAAGEVVGEVSDIAIATGEVFPRVTSLAFLGPTKTPFMLSWRKYVAAINADRIELAAPRTELRFSYLQPDEVLLARDLLNKQIVDTQGMKVVRVNDLKLSESRNQLRLLGAEVGVRGILRGLSPAVERAAAAAAHLFGRDLTENLIAWNYMDLLDRDLSHVRLSVTHKRLHELHPADVADVLEQLSPTQRARVFEHLDNVQAAEAISELEDDLQAGVIDDLGDQRASDILEEMDPDDAADIIGDLPYDKAEALLRLMGVGESRVIRSLLGYREKTAGGIMTPEVTTVTEEMTVQDVLDYLRTGAAEHESIYYVYVVDETRVLTGVISLRDLIVSPPETVVAEIAEREVFTVDADDDQEDVADMMSKYDLLALPVVDESRRILGMVTVDDALEVMEEESAEDLELAIGRRAGMGVTGVWQWVSRNGWLVIWAALFLLAAAASRAYPPLGEPLLLGLLVAAVIMRLAEDVAAHIISRVVEAASAEERPSLARRLANDGLAGGVLGLAVGIVAFAITEIWAATPELMERLFGGSFLPYQAWLGIALGAAALAVTLTGTLLGWIAETRAAKDKRAPQMALTAVLIVTGVLVFLAVLAPVVADSPVFS